MGRFFYNVSVLHGLPQAMVFPESVGTGTAISESTVRTYAHEAGYSNALVLEIENPFYRFFQLTPQGDYIHNNPLRQSLMINPITNHLRFAFGSV